MTERVRGVHSNVLKAETSMARIITHGTGIEAPSLYPSVQFCPITPETLYNAVFGSYTKKPPYNKIMLSDHFIKMN